MSFEEKRDDALYDLLRKVLEAAEDTTMTGSDIFKQEFWDKYKVPEKDKKYFLQMFGNVFRDGRRNHDFEEYASYREIET